MGFPSPATDYVELHISLDEKFIEHPVATYFMRAGQTYWREGIMNGALLVVDSSLVPCDGSLLICRIDSDKDKTLPCAPNVNRPVLVPCIF